MPELAEGARLEIVCSANPGTVGSNPTLSAHSIVTILVKVEKTIDNNTSAGLCAVMGMMEFHFSLCGILLISWMKRLAKPAN